MQMNKISALREQLQEQFKAATKHKTEITLTTAPPTYPARDAMPVEKARKKVASDFAELIREAEEWWQRHPPSEQPMENEDDPFEQFWREHVNDEEPPPVHAQRSPTGVGKTRIGAKEIAADRQRRQLIQDRSPLATRSWGYFGPTHRLNESTAAQFREPGLTAQVYYGRTAWDRAIPGNEDLPEDERTLMCLKPELVEMAVAAHQSVPDTCCCKRRRGGKTEECEHFSPGPNQCGYQRQFNSGAPDVWLAPHEMLFHDQHALSKLAGVIIDESFWSKGIYGIDERHWQIALDEMLSLPPGPIDWEKDDGTYHRILLVELLREHPLGGLQRKHMDLISLIDCTKAIHREWDIVKRVKMSPQMTEAQIEEVKQLLPECRRARRMANVFRLLRELLESKVEVSGRLVLARKDGKTILKVRGVKSIVAARNVPSMLLDATLPSTSILEKFHPQVKVVSDVEVKMPHVRVRQVLGAPTSETKLWGTKQEQKPLTGEGNRRAVRRYILQRWLEIDGHQDWIDSGRERKPLVVICQKKYHEWLEKSGLPEGIAIEHFGAIAGLDDHKDVRSLILVGRTVPPPAEVEAYAGALTGAETLSEAATGHWYGRVPRAIRMADDTGIEVKRSDQHCDLVAEAVRWQICEAELIQALGRGRGVNRTAETPLDIDILTDVVLPVTVDEVLPWTEPSEAVEMMAGAGIELSAPRDMARAWPWVWPTARAAKWTLEKLRAWSAGRAASTEDIFPIDKTLSIGEMFSVLITAALSLARPPRARPGTPAWNLYVSQILEKISSVPLPLAAALYQRHGERQKLRWVLYDLRRVSNLREKLVEKLGGTFAALLQMLSRREIKPLAGAGKVEINDNLVWTLVRETLDQLFDRAAKHPWRKLPEQQPSQQFVCDDGSQPLPCPQRHNRMRYRTPAERAAERRKREADVADIYAALPIELRLAALCLPPPPENSRRHDGQEAA
jgi:putative DNA primase/helicase